MIRKLDSDLYQKKSGNKTNYLDDNINTQNIEKSLNQYKNKEFNPFNTLIFTISNIINIIVIANKAIKQVNIFLNKFLIPYVSQLYIFCPFLSHFIYYASKKITT